MKDIKDVTGIEVAVRELNEAIIDAYEANCRAKPMSAEHRVPWWNGTLEGLRRKSRRLFNRAKGSGGWDEYKTVLSEYKKEIRKAKRGSWRDFCSEVKDLPTYARIHKLMSKDPAANFGLMERPDGTYTRDGKQTLELLLETHFPGSRMCEVPDLGTVAVCGTRPRPDEWRTSRGIFSRGRIKWALGSFQAFKSPGSDGIFPALLQRGLTEILGALRSIFVASLAVGHIPSPWTLVNVVFIPKAGKRPGNNPKSFRPISLTSFLLKTMEKVVGLHMREEVLKHRPLHPCQHAYREGRSTESALYALTRKIERTLEQGEVAMCAFLDIEGAFDNTSHTAILAALRGRGVEDVTCDWILAMLRERYVRAAAAGESAAVKVDRGCPQGGVLSPLLWSMVVDDLLIELDSTGVYSQGYADDIVVMVRGKFEETLVSVLQGSLNLIQNWCRGRQLGINPRKTTVVLFTKRTKLRGVPALRLGGEDVPLSDEVKYLGVTLDRRLNWKGHIDSALARARSAFWTSRRMIGTRWGLGPQMCDWIYEVMVKPMITYGAVVWWRATGTGAVRKKMDALQRQACLITTGAIRTTPTAAMEALLGWHPLHIKVGEVGRMGLYRLRSSGLIKERIDWDDVKNTAIEDSVLDMISDFSNHDLNIDQTFRVEIPSREEWNTGGPPMREGTVIWYTDGSKTESNVGAGVYGPTVGAEISQCMGKYCTVFQAEVHAIGLCAEENRRMGLTGKTICIFSDSQAALKSLWSPKVTSRVVWECLQTLNELGATNRVTLFWVPGHRGIEGNERADGLARAGSSSRFIGPEPFCGLSMSVAKDHLRRWANQEHQKYWACGSGLRHAREVIRLSSPGEARGLIRLDKTKLKAITELKTGHGPFKKHLHTMGLINDPVCRFCGMEEETAEHLLSVCEALCRRRLLHMGHAFPELGMIWQIPISGLLCFIRSTGLYGNI